MNKDRISETVFRIFEKELPFTLLWSHSFETEQGVDGIRLGESKWVKERLIWREISWIRKGIGT